MRLGVEQPRPARREGLVQRGGRHGRPSRARGTIAARRGARRRSPPSRSATPSPPRRPGAARARKIDASALWPPDTTTASVPDGAATSAARRPPARRANHSRSSGIPAGGGPLDCRRRPRGARERRAGPPAPAAAPRRGSCRAGSPRPPAWGAASSRTRTGRRASGRARWSATRGPPARRAGAWRTKLPAPGRVSTRPSATSRAIARWTVTGLTRQRRAISRVEGSARRRPARPASTSADSASRSRSELLSFVMTDNDSATQTTAAPLPYPTPPRDPRADGRPRGRRAGPP